jgi:predicted  nucleic acid-binding Zn-ribbon protein
MSAPATANDVAAQLGQLARDLDGAVKELTREDEKAVRAKARYEVAFSRAVLTADGRNAEARKAQATLATEREYLDAEIAAQLVRSCRARIDAIKVRIDVGRSYGAALRAEISLGGAGSGA